MAAKIMLVSVVTSTCSSGNQICKGHIGYLIPNIIHNIKNIKLLIKKFVFILISSNNIIFDIL